MKKVYYDYNHYYFHHLGIGVVATVPELLQVFLVATTKINVMVVYKKHSQGCINQAG